MDINKIINLKTFVESGESTSELDQLSRRYSEQYNEAISMFDVIINSDRANTVYKNDTPYRCLIDYGSPMKKTELGNLNFRTIREIRTKLTDDISSGDILDVEFKHSNKLEKYLILKTFETKEGYNLSVMDKCNHILKWQYECEIHEQPCVIFSRTAYKDDVYPDKMMSIISGQYEVYLPMNEMTLMFGIDQRFFIGRTVYEISHIDEMTLPNVLILTMNMTLKGNNDNEELKIANYTECNDDPTPPPDDENDKGGSWW